MNRHVAVLGPGAVGGTIAVRLVAAGCAVTCIARDTTAGRIRTRGLVLETADGSAVEQAPAVTEALVAPVDVLVIATKAPGLQGALARVAPGAVAEAVVVPLLNGVEHPAVIRAALGPRVSPASIAQFEAYTEPSGRIVQRSSSATITVAQGDASASALQQTVALLSETGFDVRGADDERRVLWEKAARLAVVAAATAASGLSVGELRENAGWRERIDAALLEACRVAAAEGVELIPASQWAIIDAMPESLTTSTARDVAAGKPSELDAIAGSVLRAGARAGIPSPALEAIVAGVAT